MEGLTSGVAVVDEAIDGVRAGDNLVLQGEPGTPLDVFVDRLVEHARGRHPTVICNVARPWSGPEPTDALVLDWHPVVSGMPSPLPRALDPHATVEDARDLLAAVDERVGVGAVFVLDSLTAIQGAWGAERALELFLWACPRLFRRRSVALWPLDRTQHRPSFLLRLAEITQVVLDLRSGGDALELEVLKADGRPDGTTGRKVRFRVEGHEVVDIEPLTSGRERLGNLVRSQRTVRGLSQTELARRIGLSPSALSQVERGLRGLSGESLMRVWEALGVPFGPDTTDDHGYRIARRGARDPVALTDGMEGEVIVEDSAAGALWRIVVRPGASGRQAPLASKGPESVLVLAGVLDVEIGGHPETLQEGDGLLLTDAALTSWANPSDVPAELLWVAHRR